MNWEKCCWPIAGEGIFHGKCNIQSELATSYILAEYISIQSISTDMEFVQKFTPPDFEAKNFTPSISPNFNSFSGKKTQNMSKNGEIYTAGKNFTLPPVLTAWTNSTSAL